MAVLLARHDQLDLPAYRRIAFEREEVAVAPALLDRVALSHAALLEHLESGAQAYGVNTGLGYLAGRAVEDVDQAAFQRSILAGRSTGVGPPLSEPVVRGAMLLRLTGFLSGHAGVSPELCSLLVDEAVPPYSLGAKEGIALINGAPLAPALGVPLLLRAEALLKHATLCGALAIAVTNAPHRPYVARVGRLKGDLGQLAIHRRLSALLAGSADHLADARQAPVSMRVIPQVHGAAADMLDNLRLQLGRELRAVTDSPVFLGPSDSGLEPEGLYPTGNFHAQALTLLLDSAAIALTQVLNLLEKRLHRLLDSRFSGLPDQLTPDPGRHSGVVTVHKQVIGLVAQARGLAAPATIHALDASTGQEGLPGPYAAPRRARARRLVRRGHRLARDRRSLARRRRFARPGAGGLGAARRRCTVREHMVLTNARVIDGTGGPPLEGASVHIEHGRIVSVVSSAGELSPAAALDLEGRTVMPGLIDAHAHLSSDISRSPGFGPPPSLKGELPRPRELGYFVLAKTARVLLAAGVTSIRDVGSYDDEAIALREAVRLGIVEGPRILSCGRIISATAPGGAIFTTMYREADGVDDMRRAVREQLRRGADFVKLMATGARSVLAEDPEPAQMTSAELEAIVDEAHRLGVRVAAHVEGLGGARLTVEAGVDTIEHGLSLHREPALLDAMARAGIVLVPTLSTFHDLAERFTDKFAPALVEQAKRQLEEAYATLAAARAAGVTLAMGHDSGPPGDNAIELVRMVDGGLSSLQGISAATRGSAQALGLPDVGTVAPGAVADLLVIDGDPLQDVRVLLHPERISMVIQEGRVVAGHASATVATPA